MTVIAIRWETTIAIRFTIVGHNHYDRPIRNREQQWNPIHCTVLWQVLLGFAVPFTSSLSKLYKNVGPNHFSDPNQCFDFPYNLLLKFVIFPVRRVGVSKKNMMLTKSCIAGIYNFLKWLLLFLICIPWYPAAIVGKNKSCEVFMCGIDLDHGLYLSHKDLGRESFHKRTCNFVQGGGLHVKVSCAYGGNLPCVRHIFNCCKVPLYVG